MRTILHGGHLDARAERAVGKGVKEVEDKPNWHGKALDHPDEAIAITKKYAPEVVPEIARREFEMTVLNWNTPNTLGKPLGWMSDKDWDATVETLKEYGGVTTPLKAADLYTNDFVPTESEFVPPAN